MLEAQDQQDFEDFCSNRKFRRSLNELQKG